MKKWCRILFCLMLVLLMLPLIPTARAETNEELEQAIIESCTYNQELDVSQYHLTLEEMQTLYLEMIDRGDLPWYSRRETFYYELDETGKEMRMFKPALLPDHQYNRALYQQRLEEIYRECVIEGMADWQIALSLHDYLIIHGYYDESLNERTGYDLLRNGKTVCTGYTEVYRALLTMAGIPCVNVVSDDMLHTWNLVQIGGKWYHVDVTWDDPTPDCYGRVVHKYFLVSDKEISSGKEPHHGWETDIPCTDDSYKNAFWKKVDSPILFTDTDTCYLIRDKKYSNIVYKRTLSTGKETAIYKEKSEFINIGKGKYRYEHHGLSLWNGRLWVGTMSKVLSMNLEGKDVRTEFTYDAKKNKRFIAGFYVHKDYIRYLTGNHKDYVDTYIQTLEPSGYHVHKYTETVVKPTCGVPGYTVSECSCGIKCQSSPTYRLEHQFVKTEIPPTFEEEGATVERCSNCGQERNRVVIPKLIFKDRLSNMGIGAILGALVGVVVVAILLIAKKMQKARAKAYPTPEEPKIEN